MRAHALCAVCALQSNAANDEKGSSSRLGLHVSDGTPRGGSPDALRTGNAETHSSLGGGKRSRDEVGDEVGEGEDEAEVEAEGRSSIAAPIGNDEDHPGVIFGIHEDHEDGACPSCDGTGRLQASYYDRIQDKHKRQKTEFSHRNQMIRDAQKSFCQTGLRTVQIFVNEVGAVSTHCTNGEIASFLELTAAYLDSEDDGHLANVDMSEVMRLFDQESESFESVRGFAERAGVPLEEIDRAQTAHEAAALRDTEGGRSQRRLLGVARDLIESYTFSLQDSDTLADSEVAGNQERRSEIQRADADPVTLNVDALGKVAGLMRDEDLASDSLFAVAWTQVIAIDKSRAERLKSISQDAIDPESCLDIKNPEWLSGKEWRVSGSTIGSLLGYGYQSSEKTIEDLLSRPIVSNFASSMMAWGTSNEDRAEQVCLRMLRKKGFAVTVEHFGVIIDPKNPEFAFSPDGLLTIQSSSSSESEFNLLEIKCPAHEKYRYRTDEEISSTSPIYGMHSWPNGQTGPCPVGYWFQIQLGCYVTQTNKCCFFIWTPREAQVHFINFDREWFDKNIYRPAKDLYWSVFVPKVKEKIIFSKKSRPNT